MRPARYLYLLTSKVTVHVAHIVDEGGSRCLSMKVEVVVRRDGN